MCAAYTKVISLVSVRSDPVNWRAAKISPRVLWERHRLLNYSIYTLTLLLKFLSVLALYRKVAAELESYTNLPSALSKAILIKSICIEDSFNFANNPWCFNSHKQRFAWDSRCIRKSSWYFKQAVWKQNKQRRSSQRSVENMGSLDYLSFSYCVWAAGPKGHLSHDPPLMLVSVGHGTMF